MVIFRGNTVLVLVCLSTSGSVGVQCSVIERRRSSETIVAIFRFGLSLKLFAVSSFLSRHFTVVYPPLLTQREICVGFPHAAFVELML